VLDRVGVCAVVRASDGKGEEMLDCLSDLQEGAFMNSGSAIGMSCRARASEYDF
jgi:hypothetical protein